MHIKSQVVHSEDAKTSFLREQVPGNEAPNWISGSELEIRGKLMKEKHKNIALAKVELRGFKATLLFVSFVAFFVTAHSGAALWTDWDVRNICYLEITLLFLLWSSIKIIKEISYLN